MKKLLRRFLSFIFFEKVFGEKLFFDILKSHLEGSASVLELGAGKSSYLNRFRESVRITGLDIHKPSLDTAKENNAYDHYIKGDARNLPAYIKPKSFDVTAAFDLLEHLTKAEGLKLIDDMGEIAEKKVMLYTPNGFLPQPAFDNNPFQEHVSGWDFKEMQRLGFKVYGVNGWRKLRGSFAVPRIRPAVLGLFISNLSWLFLKVLKKEESSFSILCIKDVSQQD